MALRAGEILFLDTNVLLTATDSARPLHSEAVRMFEEADSHGLHLAISGQVIREYLSASTRSTASNGLGLGVRDAILNLGQFLQRTILLEENEAATHQTVKLVDSHKIKGNRVHDAGLAGTMVAHRLRYLVSENGRDFLQFEGINVLSLRQVPSVFRAARNR